MSTHQHFHVTYRGPSGIETGRVVVSRDSGESYTSVRRRARQAAAWKFGVSVGRVNSLVAVRPPAETVDTATEAR